jgi:hypothetical protein
LQAYRASPMRRIIIGLLLAFAAAGLRAADYPLTPDGLCGGSRTCRAVMDAWNAATWADLVDDDFGTGSVPLATVRWYDGEGDGVERCTEPLCNDELHQRQGYTSDAFAHRFPGVTDEFGNVLLSHSMGSDQQRFQKLRNFAELLRMPDRNDLQCWKFFIDGRKNYASFSDVCTELDSAADASLRILGAYGVACAKQRSGEWATAGFSSYCEDYERQGDAIWGDEDGHGEIKQLANGQAYLANGYNTQVTAPTSPESFRPDYYELQFLMDYAQYSGSADKVQDVLDMLDDYIVSTGTNRVHRGLTGHFNAETTSFECDEDKVQCTPKPFMDANDTWRAVPALSGLLAAHPSLIPASVRTFLFDYWWNNYGGGNAAFGVSAEKPMEIWSNDADSPGQPVKSKQESYKTTAMWIPLAVAYNETYTRNAVARLVDDNYSWADGRFWGTMHYGGYFSQFAQRAIGIATGMMSPSAYVIDAPANVQATAMSTTSVRITWSAVTGADDYEVTRSTDGQSYGSPLITTGTSIDDNGLAPKTAYLYRVRARRSTGLNSAFSAPDVAATVIFTDGAITPRETPIRKLHIKDLRDAASALRVLAQRTAFSFTDPEPVRIRAVHIRQLRAAIDEALDALGIDTPGYADPNLAGGFKVRAVHITDLRSRAQ